MPTPELIVLTCTDPDVLIWRVDITDSDGGESFHAHQDDLTAHLDVRLARYPRSVSFWTQLRQVLARVVR